MSNENQYRVRIYRPIFTPGPGTKLIPIKGSYGIDGIIWNYEGNDAIRYDLSTSYKYKDGVFGIQLRDDYRLKTFGNTIVGISNLPDSYVDVRWFESDAKAKDIFEGWEICKTYLPMEKIVGLLIARDVVVWKLAKIITGCPAWEVCIGLSLYTKLCKNIPGFSQRYKLNGDSVATIMGNLSSFDKSLTGPTPPFNQLEKLLEGLHVLSDEFQLAYHIKNLGYDIELLGEGEPDFNIKGIPTELKSRYPYYDTLIQKMTQIPKKGSFENVFQEMIMEIKQSNRGLKKARIYFCNLSRLLEGFQFFSAIQMGKLGPGAVTFNVADMFLNFDIMMNAVMKFQEQSSIAVPYVKAFGPKPDIVCPFPVVGEAIKSL